MKDRIDGDTVTVKDDLSRSNHEHMALAASVQQAVWLKQFGQELDGSIKKASIEILYDNRRVQFH